MRDPAPPSIISVRGLVKSFAGRRVVDHVDLEVAAGQTFAFLGPNGAGKTTTIKMLTTLLRPDSGKILIHGFDVSRHPLEVRRTLGIVFQDCTLDMGMTVEENLSAHCAFYGILRRERRARIAEALEVFDIGDRRRDLVRGLSGGLNRRVEIARALLHRPSLVFLDEPTLGLDPHSRRLLWDHLRVLQVNTGISIFLTTHYLDEVERFAHRSAIIRRGRIIAQGTLSEIAAQTNHNSLEEAFIHLTRPAVDACSPGAALRRSDDPDPAMREQRESRSWT